MSSIFLAPHNLAWAAGLFEGEGCARVRRDRATDYPTPHVSLGMTDEEPVRRFHRVMGFGHVGTQSRRTPNPDARVLWRWESTSKSDILTMEALIPWLSPRRTAELNATLAVCVYADRTEVNRRIVAGLSKTHYCGCGRGPMYPGPLGKHRKACASA